MTEPRDPDRLIHTFLLEGAERLHDQVYDAVRADIEQKRQRVVIGPWRVPALNKVIPIGLGAAAVVVALVIGAQLLGPPPPNGVGAPSAAPSLTAAPSAAKPSASAAAGVPFVIVDDGEVRGTATVPAPGWVDGGAEPPAGRGLIWFTGDLYAYGDPCAWTTTKPEAPSTTVDELVAALTAQASRDASYPVDVTIGGHAGKSITLHVPDDAVFSQCDDGVFGSWQSPADPDQTMPSRYHQGPGQIDELWILDVDGVLVVIDAAYYAGTPADSIEQMRAMIESTTFE